MEVLRWVWRDEGAEAEGGHAEAEVAVAVVNRRRSDRTDAVPDARDQAGPGWFVVAIQGRDKFKEAIRTKLVMEVAGRVPERPVIPAAAPQPRVSCLIGEKIWQDRWGRY